jgi:acetylornithine/N-succinyldiaminopimelate aminotransferase
VIIPVLGHITTFGGHPVCCAAALANIEVIASIDIKTRVTVLEKIARDLLIHPAIKSISGKGLLLAIDFGEEHIAHQVISKCVSLGVITDWFLFAPQKLRLCPPLIITDEEMETACKLILNAIEKVYTTENE